ncbi:hypothetical protein [Bartonella sp. B1098]|uniref:hypothetical protein n=1 Tax=Bartonella sp. B1098 TaxID=2911421 RepID=UPI0020C24134|nr:hypothetical protein [Bartonella sp. B1098]
MGWKGRDWRREAVSREISLRGKRCAKDVGALIEGGRKIYVGCVLEEEARAWRGKVNFSRGGFHVFLEGALLNVFRGWGCVIGRKE